MSQKRRWLHSAKNMQQGILIIRSRVECPGNQSLTSSRTVMRRYKRVDKLSTVHISSGLELLGGDLRHSLSLSLESQLSVNGRRGEANVVSADRRSCCDFRFGLSAPRIRQDWLPYNS